MTQTHSEQTARGEVEVTQADRDAAADIWQLTLGDRGNHTAMRKGSLDHHSVVQAFARHRLASLSPADNGALGEAARKAHRYINVLCRHNCDPTGIEVLKELDAALSTTPDAVRGEVERYGASRFDLAAPGDRQKQRWILRFDDADRREMHFTDEAEAWAAWNQFSPSWNCYLFTLATLHPSPEAPIEGQDVERAITYIRDWCPDHVQDYFAALRAPVERKGEAIYEECARIAKGYWVEADYDTVGVADADMAMELCEQIATAIRNAAGEKA